jgi:hypothetical protein
MSHFGLVAVATSVSQNSGAHHGTATRANGGLKSSRYERERLCRDQEIAGFYLSDDLFGRVARGSGPVAFTVLGFDVLKDPIVGYLSDRSRCGHRVPWIASGALILAVAMVAMFAGLSWQGNALWVGL